MKITRGKPYKKEAKALLDFPGGPVGKNLPANAGDAGSVLDLGRFLVPWGN